MRNSVACELSTVNTRMQIQHRLMNDYDTQITKLKCKNFSWKSKGHEVYVFVEDMFIGRYDVLYNILSSSGNELEVGSYGAPLAEVSKRLKPYTGIVYCVVCHVIITSTVGTL